jgi:hypothetical protein
VGLLAADRARNNLHWSAGVIAQVADSDFVKAAPAGRELCSMPAEQAVGRHQPTDFHAKAACSCDPRTEGSYPLWLLPNGSVMI